MSCRLLLVLFMRLMRATSSGGRSIPPVRPVRLVCDGLLSGSVLRGVVRKPSLFALEDESAQQRVPFFLG